MGDQTTKRFNPNKWQVIPRAKMEEYLARMEDEDSRRFWRNCLLTLAIGAVIFTLALWAVMEHYGKV